MNSKLIVLGFGLLLIFSAFAFATETPWTKASHDARVESGYPTINFDSKNLGVGRATIPIKSDKQTFILFPTAIDGTRDQTRIIDSATCRFYYTTYSISSYVNVFFNKVTGTWDESNIRWNNKPQFGDGISSKQYNNYDKKPPVNSYVDWDCTQAFRDAYYASKDLNVGFDFYTPEQNNPNYLNLSSKDDELKGDQLDYGPGIKVVWHRNEPPSCSSDR